ncbi:DUF6054 family protein [Alkalibacter mobilis]|uniref:DUF6054 family protein n=1 Tax=Alkalibacter mobilis TaxID=2787712 RepID=UPI00189EF9C1|nr:DUF6054 family protein [Alkalibacter mobilis]MBF7095632.1 hypothetical protein [Alkalibacter mobilis]
MAKLSMKGTGDFTRITNLISRKVENSGMSVELVDYAEHHIGDVSVCTLVYEKYFMRASNRATLTVAVVGNKDEIIVDAIGAGGGQGPIFKFSWGAEEDFVSVVESVLREENFNS